MAMGPVHFQIINIQILEQAILKTCGVPKSTIFLWLLEISCGFESRQALRVASVQHFSNTLLNNTVNLLLSFGPLKVEVK